MSDNGTILFEQLGPILELRGHDEREGRIEG